MYLGKLVETATSEELYAHPLHPYTQVLLSNALPGHPDDTQDEVILKGEVPSAFEPPAGCRFHPRCPHALPVCGAVEPTLSEQSSGHLVACHLYRSGAITEAGHERRVPLRRRRRRVPAD